MVARLAGAKDAACLPACLSLTTAGKLQSSHSCMSHAGQASMPARLARAKTPSWWRQPGCLSDSGKAAVFTLVDAIVVAGC